MFVFAPLRSRRRARIFACACAVATCAAGGCAAAPPVAGPTYEARGTVSVTETPAVLAGVGNVRDGQQERANLSPESQRPSEPAQLAVAGVHVDSYEGFDRVVVDLAGDGEPGWFVDYTTTPMQVAVGKPLAVNGETFLNINVDGTVHPGEFGVDTADLVQVASPSDNVVEVVNGGTSEGRSQIVVGLRGEAPFSVEVLDDPKRLVVDIQA